MPLPISTALYIFAFLLLAMQPGHTANEVSAFVVGLLATLNELVRAWAARPPRVLDEPIVVPKAAQRQHTPHVGAGETT